VGHLRFYWTLYRVALKARTEYRVDFAIGVVTALMTQLSALAFYWVVFARFPSLGGWPPAGVLFLFAMSAMVLGLAEVSLNGIWMLPWYITSGELDRLLLYPVRSLSFLLIARPELHALGNLGLGAVLLGLCFGDLPLSPWALLLVPLWVVSGALIYTAGLVLMGSLCFYMLGTWAQHFLVIHHLLNAARYPVSIYPRWLQLLLLTAFPIGVASFVPGRWIFGQSTLLWAALAPPLTALLAVFIAQLGWALAVRQYQSTGS
jgi:ABC-2 type transport system permease protein